MLARHPATASDKTLSAGEDDGFAHWDREPYRRVFASVPVVAGDPGASTVGDPAHTGVDDQIRVQHLK